MKNIILRGVNLLCVLAVCMCLFASCGTSKVDKDFEKAQEAYELLGQAEEICIKGMDVIYDAWFFAVYDLNDCTASTVIDKLALATGMDAEELKTTGGYSGEQLMSDWNYCIWAVQNCFDEWGDYTEIEHLLSQSKECIQELSEDYKYINDFKDYYSKVSSYTEYFKEPTGSFEKLADTIADYENSIRTAKEVFKFDFEE